MVPATAPLVLELPEVEAEYDDEDAYTDEEYADDEEYVDDEEVAIDEEASVDEAETVNEESTYEETGHEDTHEATGSSAGSSLTEGSTDTVLPYEFSIESIEMVEITTTYTFVGWYTSPDPTPAERFDFSTPISGNMNLYAQWAADAPLMHTVIFHRNDGTGTTHSTVYVTNGTSLTAPANAPTRGGHTFRGWFTDTQATQAFTGFGAPLIGDEAITLNLYAGWTVNPPPPGGNNGGGWTPPPVQLPEEEPPLAEWDGEHHAFMIGFADGTVRPRADVTRAQVATILFRLMTDISREHHWQQTNPFPDVVLSNWHNNAVSTTFNANIFFGMPDGTFMPDRGITRAELAATIVRFKGVSPNYGAAQFNDISGHWAQGYINAAARNGWVVGDNGLGNQFRPNDTITRAETAAIINRAFDRLPHGPEDLLPGMRTWPDNANPNAWYYLYIQEATNSHKYAMHEDGIHESWVELISPERPWSLLERPTSRPDDLLRAAS